MWRKILTGVFFLCAASSWFVRKTVDAWFFDKVVHIAEKEVLAFLSPLVEYGPPALFAAATLLLLWRPLKRELHAEPAFARRPEMTAVSRTALRPRPNIRLHDVFQRITGLTKMPLSIEPAGMDIYHACNEIREKALNGIVTVFGGIDWRTTIPADYDRMVRAAIPADFWKNHKIDCIGYLQPDDNYRGFTCDMTGYRSPEDFYGLWFDESEVDAVWPRKREQTDKWTWPALTREELNAVYEVLKPNAGQGQHSVHIACNNAQCGDLAESMGELFRRLAWPYHIGSGLLDAEGARGLLLTPDNDTSRLLKQAIESETDLLLEILTRTRDSGSSAKVMLIVGSKN